MATDLYTVWLYVAPPIVGGVIGYFTNDIAIKMLFRPYRAYYIGQRRIPFTPGLIPRNQERLALRVSQAIMGSLLTPDELHNMARRLLDTDRVQAAILWLLRLALDQIQHQDREERTARILANVLEDLCSQSLPRVLKVLARREDFLEAQLNQIFDQVLLEFQLTDEQADKLAEWLLQVILPPDVLRLALVDFLTDRNIQIIDEGFREKSSGTYWVIANLFGLRNALTRLRSYCLDEKEQANTRLAELIQSLSIQQRLKAFLKTLSLQNLPVSTVRQLRRTMRDSVRVYLQTRGADLIQGLGRSIDWQNIAALIISRLRNSAITDVSLELVSKELALILDRYLDADLEKLMEQVLPVLNLDQVIVDRIKATPPKNMEDAVQAIVREELQAIVNLGGILGVTIGLLQSISLLMR
ncbi:MAG: DUF445 family protein [Cyanobacteria bacterium]|nr:DUF445 family protein [Cyanobacteriota bacterium]MDW8200519.1 DUF445 family protein [Cyanobacteriota bacterium SKYGB_h_bin112]